MTFLAKLRPWAPVLLTGVAVGYLWWILVSQLRPEWTVNPQYNYAWAVPFLCAYLLHRRLRKPGVGRQKLEDEERRAPGGSQWTLRATAILLAGLYLPTRLIQEANPEWRLISWLLALEIIGLTLLAIDWMGGRSRVRQFASPIFFFLVAVPWPSIIERPLIQGLTRVNTAITVEGLGLLGFPAVQRGNTIEIATGVVGIDEACSGIRSFQASLMIALLLGEVWRLGLTRRVVLALAGFALTFAFNVGRTFLLTGVAIKQGLAAVSQWHDPAGVTILVACFLGLWLLGLLLKGREAEVTNQTTENNRQRVEGDGQQPALGRRPSELGAPNSEGAFGVRHWAFPLALGLWILFVEVGTELWYRSHESQLTQAANWSVQWPRDNPTFRELPMSEKARQFLRYDEAHNATWRERDTRWQVIYLRWQPGRIALHLAQSHTPEVCLTAAGRKLEKVSDLKWPVAQSLRLPFRILQMSEAGRPVHVFYCLWKDRTEDQAFKTEMLTYGNRLAPVLAGRRNLGQRSLEIAVWGLDDAQEAEAMVSRRLEKLVKVEE